MPTAIEDLVQVFCKPPMMGKASEWGHLAAGVPGYRRGEYRLTVSFSMSSQAGEVNSRTQVTLETQVGPRLRTDLELGRGFELPMEDLAREVVRF